MWTWSVCVFHLLMVNRWVIYIVTTVSSSSLCSCIAASGHFCDTAKMLCCELCKCTGVYLHTCVCVCVFRVCWCSFFTPKLGVAAVSWGHILAGVILHSGKMLSQTIGFCVIINGVIACQGSLKGSYCDVRYGTAVSISKVFLHQHKQVKFLYHILFPIVRLSGQSAFILFLSLPFLSFYLLLQGDIFFPLCFLGLG